MERNSSAMLGSFLSCLDGATWTAFARIGGLDNFSAPRKKRITESTEEGREHRGRRDACVGGDRQADVIANPTSDKEPSDMGHPEGRRAYRAGSRTLTGISRVPTLLETLSRIPTWSEIGPGGRLISWLRR